MKKKNRSNRSKVGLTGREATQFKPGQSGNPAGRPPKRVRPTTANQVSCAPSAKSPKERLDELLLGAGSAEYAAYLVAFERWETEFYKAARDPTVVNALWDKVLVAHKAALGKETSEELEEVKRCHTEERRWERLISLSGIKWSGLTMCGFQSSDEYNAWFVANPGAMQRLYGRTASPQQARPS